MKNPRQTAGDRTRRRGLSGQARPRPFARPVERLRAGIRRLVRGLGRLAGPFVRAVAESLSALSCAPARRPALATIAPYAASARNRRSRIARRR